MSEAALRTRIDQTCFGRSGGFWPINLPLFQGSRATAVALTFSRLFMTILPRVTVDGQDRAPEGSAWRDRQLPAYCGRGEDIAG